MSSPEYSNGVAHDSRLTESVIQCNPYLPDQDLRNIQRQVLKGLLTELFSMFPDKVQFLYNNHLGPQSQALLTTEEWQALGINTT